MKLEMVSKTKLLSDTPASPLRETVRQQALTVWRQILRLSERRPRRLRLCESLPLGDRRFVAVVEYEQCRFLLGGTSASIVLLARLGDNTSIAASSEQSASASPAAQEAHS